MKIGVTNVNDRGSPPLGVTSGAKDTLTSPPKTPKTTSNPSEGGISGGQPPNATLNQPSGQSPNVALNRSGGGGGGGGGQPRGVDVGGVDHRGEVASRPNP